MERKGFVFYSSFYEAAKMLKKPTQRLAFYEGIIKYAFEGTEPSESDPLVNALLEMAYPVLKSSREKFEKRTDKSTDKSVDKNTDKSTDKSADKSTDKSTDKSVDKNTDKNTHFVQTLSNEFVRTLSNDKEKEKEKDIDREKEKEKEKETPGKPDTHTRFKAPDVDEVRAYAAENGYNLDAERFVDYYTSNGWKVGRNPMKDWKAAVRNWCKGENGSSKPVQAKRDPNAIGFTESQRAEMDRLMAEWEAEEKRDLKQG